MTERQASIERYRASIRAGGVEALMRIAVANANLRKLGGVESYLNEILPALGRHGHEVAVLCERDVPAGRARIAIPAGAPVWCVPSLGAQAALDSLASWKPEIIYAHRLTDYNLEEKALALAPAVCFVHDYQRSCLSGTKAFGRPVTRPCHRRFGLPCLALYFPRQCGKSRRPGKVLQAFFVKSRQTKLLHRYRAVVTHSQHMRDEILNHGFSEQFVHRIDYPVEPKNAAGIAAHVHREPNTPARLLFAGRMERIKGGDLLLDALPQVERSLRRPIEMTFAGDGPLRGRWQERANQIEAANARIGIKFPGWLEKPQLEEVESKCDIVVIPSVWPEPFGRIGPEAGLQGLPAAAFAVGGIPEWLIDGVNGHLASAEPPTSAGLAEAITKSLLDSDTHSRLRAGAFAIAKKLTLEHHVEQLCALFTDLRAPAHITN